VLQLLFVVIAVVGLLAALGTVLARNLVHAALYLIAFFFVVACQFAFLDAELLAAVQVLVYVGAVAILMMFGIMLTRNIQGDDTTTVSRVVVAPAAVAVFGLFCVLVYGINDHNGVKALSRGGWTDMKTRPPATAAMNNSGPVVGTELVNRYAVAFEVAGLMLTAALVGAVALAHRDAEDEAADRNESAASRAARAVSGTNGHSQPLASAGSSGGH
jgi:NADH:ubiquinone oxidoreductase subunit 6 (subunit J)